MARRYDDYIGELTPKEANHMLVDFLKAGKEKLPQGLRTDEEYKEPFKFLCADKEVLRELHQGRYTNLAFPAWKSFAPKFCGKPPIYIVKQQIESTRMLAEGCQKLFAYKMAKFKYSDMILSVSQDAFFTPCGYGKHSFDKRVGMTVTKRVKPTNVIWDYTANTPETAKWVMEKHRLRRCEFAHKFGWEVANRLPDAENQECDLPNTDRYKDGKHPLAEVEYYQVWSRINDYHRVYTFLEEWPEGLEDEWITKSKKDGKPGEPWPLLFDDGEWPFTQLKLSNVNNRIGGLSTWQAGRGTYLQLQDLLGAQAKASEESAKKVLVYPQAMHSLMQKVSAAGGTLSLVPYDRQKAEVNNINESLELIEFPGPDENLIAAANLAEQRWSDITGLNAVNRIEPQSVETAVEARTLSDASNNRIADDQGAVERWVTLIGKKELKCDLSRIPRRSSIRVVKPDGRAETMHDIPYLEACLLEKGIVDEEAALSQVGDIESAEAEGILSGADPQQARANAMQLPADEEIKARINRNIGLADKVDIITPGVEQFIGPELSQYWMEDLTFRQIESMLLVTIQLGSSSAAGRSQQVNEVLMILKLLEPIYREFQLWDKLAFMYNSVLDASELEQLKDAKLVGPELKQAMEQLQAQAEAAAQAEFERQIAIKTAFNPNDPTARMKAEADVYKAKTGLQKANIGQQNISIQAGADEARDRRKAESQILKFQIDQANAASGITEAK